MKKVVFFILVTFGFGHIVLSQNISVYYNWSTNFPVEEMVAHGSSQDLILKMNNHIRPRVYYYSDGRSVYQTLAMESNNIEAAGKSIIMRQYVEPSFYKNFAEYKIFIVDMKNDSTSATVMNMEELSWEILSDSLEILGHPCRKAGLKVNGKFTHFAWYALDIPIMDGPEQYYGLPGLILELQAPGGWVISASRIQEGKNDLSLTPRYREEIDYQEYLKRRKMYGRGLKP